MRNKTRLMLTALAAVIPCCGLPAAESGMYHVDPAKVLGPESCAECHAPMVEAWKLTHHFDTFNTMHRRPEAREIAQKLGLRRIKSESLCLECHYTSRAAAGEEPKPVAGISCESCHNAGADWNKTHSNKDDPDRLTKAAKLGLIRPADYYHVAANCYSCHTVPEEKLVNVAGHTAGSDFELVAWSQGEVRHNFPQSAGKKNEDATPAAKRMLYILGRALDLEYGLRGLAKATGPGKYAESMTKRISDAKARLAEIQAAAKSEQLGAMLATIDAGQLKPNNQAALAGMAAKISELSQKFAAVHDGTKLSAVDPLIPGPDKYKGKVYQP